MLAAAGPLLALPLAAQTPAVVLNGLDQAGAHLRLVGTASDQYQVEASDDLVTWRAIGTFLSDGTNINFFDPEATQFFARFYRARALTLGPDAPGTFPRDLDVLVGDTIPIRVFDPTNSGVAWSFAVNGVVGGDDASGRIKVSATDPTLAFYTAPTNCNVGSVTVTAFNPAQPSQQWQTALRVHCLNGNLVIAPSQSLVPLGGTVSFQAGINVTGVGFVPLQNLSWKVNGLLGGNADMGGITSDGVYTAPPQMPTNLPASIQVGFSLAPSQNPLALAPITLAELIVTPERVVSKTAGPADTLNAMLHKSDDSNTPVPVGDLSFSSSLPGAATVDAQGTVQIGNDYGLAAISVSHNTLALSDTVLVESRSDIAIDDVDVQLLTDGDVSLDQGGPLAFTHNVRGIEVTQPRALVQIAPLLEKFRGFRNIFSPQNPLSGADNPAVTFQGDSSFVFSFDRNGQIPQLFGATAIIEQKSGLLQIGDEPGQGVLNVEYDDGVSQAAYPVNITYSRLNLDVQAQGATSGGTNEVFISEWIDFEVTLSNTNPLSDFIGKTPVRIVQQDGGSFYVASQRNLQNGGGNLGASVPFGFDQETLEKTAELVLQAPTEPNTVGQIGGAPNPNRGKLHFRVSPTETGPITFVISVPSDSGIPPREISLMVKRPTLRIRDGVASPDFRNVPGYAARDGSVLVPNSYVDLEVTNGPTPFDFKIPGDQLTGITGSQLLSRSDPLVWRIVRPDSSTNIVPVGTAPGTGFYYHPAFSYHFTDVGTYHVSLGFTKRSEIATEALAIKVVPATDLVLGDKNPEQDDRGVTVTLNHQLSAVRITAPVGGAWLPGVPINVSVQTYDGNGLPAAIGKVIHTIYDNSDGSTTETFSYAVEGVKPFRISGPFGFQVQGDAFPDNSGAINFQIIPPATATTDEDATNDLVVVLAPWTYEPTNFTGLPEELFHYDKNGNLIASNLVAVGVSDYVNPLDNAFLRQDLMVFGRGLNAAPSEIPVASSRLRAAAGTTLPAGADRVTFRLRGTSGFAEELAGGIPTLDLGSGFTDAQTSVDGDALVINAATDLAYFEADPNNRYGDRTIAATFSDSSRWVGTIRLDKVALQPFDNGEPDPANGKDPNLPLNGGYGTIPQATAAVNVALLPDDSGSPVDLELRPSIYAGWDTNRDGIAEPGEDLNGDGEFTSADAQPGGGAPFRGVYSANPLVGFDRDTDANGLIRVRKLKTQLRPIAPNPVLIYGNDSDDRRLDPFSNGLGPVGDPDGLPDFVSRQTDGETLIASVGGNYADVMSFTAYNFVAKVNRDQPDPQLEFDTRKSQGIHDVYAQYSGFNPGSTLASVAASSRITEPFLVWVDHEVSPWILQNDGDFIYDAILPFHYYGGVLDQYYQKRTEGGGFGNPVTTVPTSRDGRVRAFDDRFGQPTPTGIERHSFGLDLDGVLYDPGVFNPLHPVTRDPNGADLLAIPVVTNRISLTGGLTTNDLLPRVGGTSGGDFDLNKETPGRFLVESKTPGADFPGMHAGHLVYGKPLDLIDPRFSAVEDRIRDVLIKRAGAAGTAGGGAIQQEDRFFGTPRDRRVMIFGENEDKKAPLRTAAESNFKFKIETDPATLTAGRVGLLRFKSLLLVRELPQAKAEPNLIVTTQSTGNEKTVKILADTAVDLAVDLASTAILTTISEGSYLEACGGTVADKVKSAGVNLTIGLMDSEYVDPYITKPKKDAVKFVNAAYNGAPVSTNLPGGVAIPGITIPGVKSLVKSAEVSIVTNILATLKNGPITAGREFKVSAPLTVSVCSLVQQPFDALKNAIKSTYSAESFGGLGTAQAMGMKLVAVTIPRSAQLGTNGLYSVHYSISRKIDIVPREPSFEKLSALPYQTVFGDYPSPDRMSDADLLDTLYEKLDDPDPTVAQAAQQILRAIGRKSVQREMGINDAVNGRQLYRSYKIRSWKLPRIEVEIGPRQLFDQGDPVLPDDDTQVGDFQLTPGETEIPVSAAGMAIVSRSNENSGGMAKVGTGGFEMIIRHAVILPPDP